MKRIAEFVVVLVVSGGGGGGVCGGGGGGVGGGITENQSIWFWKYQTQVLVQSKVGSGEFDEIQYM